MYLNLYLLNFKMQKCFSVMNSKRGEKCFSSKTTFYLFSNLSRELQFHLVQLVLKWGNPICQVALIFDRLKVYPI